MINTCCANYIGQNVSYSLRRGSGISERNTMDKKDIVLTNALQTARRRARAEVNRRAALSAGATLLPIPGIDIAVDVTSLVSMLNAVNREFLLDPEQIAGLSTEERVAVFKAIGSVKAVFAGQYVTNAAALILIKQLGARWAAGKTARWIPVVGQGAAAALSFAAFKWLGEEHIRECMAVREKVGAMPALPCRKGGDS